MIYHTIKGTNCEGKLDKMYSKLNKYNKTLTIFFILTYLIIFLNQ